MSASNRDLSLADRIWDLPVALVLLTRLPLPPLPDHAFERGARAVWAYPLVGVCLGLVAALISGLATWMGLGPEVTAGVVLAALVMLTGAMHEDGLADSADGLWGGHDKARRLEIMKDSRIGAYGVLALILAMGLRWQGIASLPVTGLVAALILSRAMMPVLMLSLPHARADGLSRSVGAPSAGPVIAGIAIAALCTLVLCGTAAFGAVIAAGLVTALMRRLAMVKIGGQTGDILGATQIVTEIAVLLTLTTLMT